MRRIRQIWKGLLVFLAVAMLTLGPAGCGKKDEQPSKEHPSEEHPAGEHPG